MTAIEAYRRLTAAGLVLTELAAGPDAAGLAEVIGGEEMALARMRAALAVLAADGVPVEPVGSAAALLAQAVRWQRYARGPVTALHRDCADDAVRGLLWLWARQRTPRGPARSPRLALGQARVRLLGEARSRCAALRADLREATAITPAEVARRVAEVSARMHDAVGDALAEAGLVEDGAPPVPSPAVPPPPRVAGPERRLTLLLGAGFGVGAALAESRVLAGLIPSPPGAAGPAGILVGLVLGIWVVRTRRAIAERASRDRWIGEITAALRAALEQEISTRILAAHAAAERPGGRLTA